MVAMCGRYSITARASDLVAEFDIGLVVDETPPSWNVAPTDPVPAVVEREPRGDEPESLHPVRQLRTMRWGLVPSWAKDPKIGSRMINARSETLTEKPSYRSAAARRRCILPAAGFYEWQTESGKKLPYFLHDPQNPILAFAGLYELWPDPDIDDDDQRWLWTCTVITRPATDALGHIHDRTPVIVPPDLRDDWLDCAAGAQGVADELLRAIPDPHLEPYRVSTAVNSVRNDGPQLLEPVGEERLF